MKKLVKGRIPMTVVAAIFCAPAMAAQYFCSGPVTGVTVSPSGVVQAENAGGQSWGYFCQIGATNNGVSSDACKAILTVLLTAQATGKSVTIAYDDANNCTTSRAWSWLNTIYWGPKIDN